MDGDKVGGGKATLFAKGTGLRALLERNGFEFIDYDEEKLREVQETMHRILKQKGANQ